MSKVVVIIINMKTLVIYFLDYQIFIFQTNSWSIFTFDEINRDVQYYVKIFKAHLRIIL